MSPRPGSDGGPLAVEESASGPDVSPLIRQADDAFRRDLRQLLEGDAGRWVAYHGAERIRVGSTKAELYRGCLDLGLRRGEFLVRSIEPEQGEVVLGPGIPEADPSARGG